VATPAAAPVRKAVISVASMIASGLAVAGSDRMYTPITDGSLWRAGFSGCELTHFTPAAPAMSAGMARKSPSCSGRSRYTFDGIRVSPRPWARNARSTAARAMSMVRRRATSARVRMRVGMGADLNTHPRLVQFVLRDVA
jgi:hypothetical protein